MRILLMTDHEPVEMALRQLICAEFDVVELHCRRELGDALATCAGDGPWQLVMLDLDMPGVQAGRGLDRIAAMRGEAKLVALGAALSSEQAQVSAAAGVSLYLHKNLPSSMWAAALRSVLSTASWRPPGRLSERRGPRHASG